MRPIVPLLLGCLLLAPSVLSSQEPGWKLELLQELGSSVEELETKVGARLVPLGREPQFGSLEEEQPDELEIALDGAGRYAILGVCDEDCIDIDLYLYDASGQEIAKHTDEDARPWIMRKEGGQFVLEVYMVECYAAPCYYAVGVFRME